METRKGKRTAKLRLTLSKRSVDGLQPSAKPWIAWDDKLTGFGVRTASGTKSFLVNYGPMAAGVRGQQAFVIGRFGASTGPGAQAGPALLGASPQARTRPPSGQGAGLPTLQAAFGSTWRPIRGAAVTVKIYRRT